MDTEAILGLLKETAAEVITPRFHQLAADEIVEKRPGDLVTIADREAEQRIGATPSSVRSAEPVGTPPVSGSSTRSTGPGTSCAAATSTGSWSRRPVGASRPAAGSGSR